MATIINLKERIVNIALKADTKRELDKLGTRRDSYDDIVRMLIHGFNETSKQNKTNKNLIESYPAFKRKEDEILIEGIKIKYSFNIPQRKHLRNYTFDVRYLEILHKNKKIGKNYSNSSLDLVLDYIKIIEKIIKRYIDPLFRLEKNNRNRLNLAWWERKFNIVGLSYESFKRDIQDKWIELGVI